MIPYHLNCRDEESLVGGVNEAQGGAEADHVELRIALGEESALESGMYAAHDGSLAEEFLVALHHDLLQLRVSPHLPGRIAVAADGLCTGKLKGGLDGGAHIVEVRHHVASL